MLDYSIEYLNDNNVWTVLEDWTRPIINRSKLTEALDETQIFLSASKLSEPFKPFTRFIINITEYNDNNVVINNDTLYRVVVGDEVEQVFFEGDGLYDHNIYLAEAAKELERYTVDNISFTNEWAKAFQQSNALFNIKDFQIYDGWYNDYNIRAEKTTGSAGYQTYWFYFYQLYSDYNSGDAVSSYYRYYPVNPVPNSKPNIENTYVGKTLYNYNYPADYTFSSNVPNAKLVGETFNVPSITVSSIPQKYIIYQTYNPILGVDTRKTDAWINWSSSVDSIQVISPTGTITSLSVGDAINFTETGRYKLVYTVSRKFQSYEEKRVRLTEELVGSSTSPLYTASTVKIEFDIFSFTSYVNVSDKLTIYDILNKLINTTPTKFNGDTKMQYSLFEDGTSASIFSRYASFDAPEMIFTNKNLWEALREIGGVINAIPYLHISDKDNWNIIDFFPLSSEERVSINVEEEYSNSTSYYDSENYTGCYDISVDNMISPVSSDDGYLSEAGYKIAKSIRSEEVEISETSMNIQTVYPIYKVNSLKYVNYTLSPSVYDLTNALQEYAIYETLVSKDVDKGKAITLYYRQGRKNIEGLQYKVSQNDYADAENKVVIKDIIRVLTGVTLDSESLLKSKFIVDYIPFLNARVKIYKPNAPKIGIDTSMFQNQTANVIDARAMGKKMVANISRVGNLGYVDSVRVYSLKNIPLKGQRSSDGYFVSTVSTEYDKFDILSSIEYTKDYQKISEWINISNLQRYYEVSEKQSINRYINTNMFYVYGDAIAELGKENGLNQKQGYLGVNYIADLLLDYGHNKKINASLLTAYSDTYFLTTDTTYQADKDYYVSPLFGTYTLLVEGVDYTVGGAISGFVYNISSGVISKVYLNSNAIAIGNNISIITDYMDNYGSGYQAVPYKRVNNTDALMNRSIPYSDNFGKIDHILVENITDSNIEYPSSGTLEANINKLALSLPAISAIDEETLKPTGAEYITIADSYQGDNKPTFSKIGCNQDISVLKDSREIIHFNQQHHFLVNDSSVVLGNLWTESCRFIQNIDASYKLVFLKDKIDIYENNIKASDIIALEEPEDTDLADIFAIIQGLCTEITSDNILKILSTIDNTNMLYILPNIEYNGLIVGLREPAQAWAIVRKTDNKLLIGKNQFINNTNLSGEDTVALAINQSITKEY